MNQYKSGVQFESPPPSSEKETALAMLETLKDSLGINKNAKYVAKCKSDNPVTMCDWSEVKTPTINDPKTGRKVAEFYATCGELAGNKRRVRNFISRCSECNATMFDMEMV